MRFYRELKKQNVRVGMEASGYARWFERWLCDLQFEWWIGNAAQIRTKRVGKQKTDRQDAAHTIEPSVLCLACANLHGFRLEVF